MRNRDQTYAQLLIGVGINIQKGQTLYINAAPEHHQFVTMLTEEAYKRGAKEVIVNFQSEAIMRLHYLYQDIETLTEVPQWLIDEHHDYISKDLCKLALRSPNPGLLHDVDSKKMMARTAAQGQALEAFRNYSMNNEGQWLVAAYPNDNWAQAVYPHLPLDEAYAKLYEAILKAVYIEEANDPFLAWQEHNRILAEQSAHLNQHNFKALHFTNQKGTDITVGLVKDHIWAGGQDSTTQGRLFNPNMPTEETFTSPDRYHVDGIVYNTLPLNFNGNIIDDFWLKFKDGEVIDFDAGQGKEVLTSLLDTDEGSRRIGEIALVSYHSPISNLHTLFYNTLFDENASCHMALGKAYPLIAGAKAMSQAEQLEKGLNQSLVHVDFMFGSEDMQAIGIMNDGQEIEIIRAGDIILK